MAAATAHAHEPYEITTDAHITHGRLDVHVLVAVRTAAPMCLSDEADQRRLVADPSGAVTLRDALESCARRLYAVSSNGQPLVARQVRVFRTEEDDLDLRVVYPEPGPGALRFEALQLRRLADPTYGATLTVTGPGVFLGQKVLRARDPVLETRFVPAPMTVHSCPQSALRRHVVVAISFVVAAGAIAWGLSKLLRPSQRRPAAAAVLHDARPHAEGRGER